MLKFILFFCFTVALVSSQNTSNNDSCRNQNTYNYYYSKDVNPGAGPTIQSQADVLQGRPGKVGPRGFKGDRGEQGEPGLPDNSLFEILRSEVAEATARLTAMNEDLEVQLNSTKNELSIMQTQFTNAQEESDEIMEGLRGELTATTNRLFLLEETLVTTDCGINASFSGVYFIRSKRQYKPVYCEVDDNGIKWLVFQRRVDESVDFFRNWTDYQNGFGDVRGNLWIGLDLLHIITRSGSYQLRVDLEDWEGNNAYALYSSFSVGNETSNYRLSISGYSGTAGDSLGGYNNRQFSSKDRDNDSWGDNCAVRYRGAWWYGACYSSNLNGEYLRNQISDRSANWYRWKNNHYALKRSVMKIRRN